MVDRMYEVMRVCTKCKKELPFTTYYFHKSKRTKDGFSRMCKKCSGSKYGDPRHKWTKEEENRLAQVFSKRSNADIVEKEFPYLSVNQIASKARKLELLKNEDYIYNMQVEKAMKHLELIPDQTGKNNPRWNSFLISCDICDTEYYTTPYKNALNNNNFCSTDCRSIHQSKSYTGKNNPNYGNRWSDRQRAEAAERAVKQLIAMDFASVQTEPERITEDILADLGIKYEKEFDCKYYLVDFYLPESQLMIEVQGNFFHCHPLMNLENSRKRKILSKDKRKNTYIKNWFNVEVLYLWEEDLKNHVEKCKKLIARYIEKEGKLHNYHSYNYQMSNKDIQTISNVVDIGY